MKTVAFCFAVAAAVLTSNAFGQSGASSPIPSPTPIIEAAPSVGSGTTQAVPPAPAAAQGSGSVNSAPAPFVESPGIAGSAGCSSCGAINAPVSGFSGPISGDCGCSGGTSFGAPVSDFGVVDYGTTNFASDSFATGSCGGSCGGGCGGALSYDGTITNAASTELWSGYSPCASGVGAGGCFGGGGSCGSSGGHGGFWSRPTTRTRWFGRHSSGGCGF